MRKRRAKVKCRLCGSKKLQLCLALPNTPRNISRLLKPKELKKDRVFRFNVCSCQECGFIQAINALDATSYKDYSLTWSHSSEMGEYRLAQASTFLKKYNLKGKRIIEIGCGDGEYVRLLRQLGAEAFGIEPSRALRRIAASKKLKIFSGYVGPKKKIPGAPYDAFIARQVLEHVPDPNGFLRGIRLSLKDDAVGLVEIPNLHKDLKNKRFYNFFPDHLSYFSVRTLRFALERNGFSVLNVKTGMSGEFLEAYVKTDPQLALSDLQDNINVLSKNVHALIADAIRRRKKVAVWGAGYKGNMLLAVVRGGHIEYVVDSDKYKQGLFTPASHLPVVSPDYMHQHPVDMIIVTTMTFVKDVIDQIRKNLGFKGTIVTLYQLSRSDFRKKLIE